MAIREDIERRVSELMQQWQSLRAEANEHGVSLPESVTSLVDAAQAQAQTTVDTSTQVIDQSPSINFPETNMHPSAPIKFEYSNDLNDLIAQARKNMQEGRYDPALVHEVAKRVLGMT